MTFSINGACGPDPINLSLKAPGGQLGSSLQVAVSERLDADQRRSLSGFVVDSVNELHLLLRTQPMREMLWWKVSQGSLPVLQEISCLSTNLLSEGSPGRTALVLPFSPLRIMTLYEDLSLTGPGVMSCASGGMLKRHGTIFNSDSVLETIPSRSLLQLLGRLLY